MPLSCLPGTTQDQQWGWQEAHQGKGGVAQTAGDNVPWVLG